MHDGLDFLGPPPPEPTSGLAEMLNAVRTGLERFVTRPEIADGRRVDACRLLFDVHNDQSALLARESQRTAHALGHVREVIEDLLDSATDQIVADIPVRMCRDLSFGRAMISSIRSAVWVPRHLHIESDDSPENNTFLDYVHGAHIPLSHAPLETEIVRTRTSTMTERATNDRRTFKELVAVSRSDGYVAAPIVSRGRTIGILHADRPQGRSEVCAGDLTVVSALGECLSSVLERAKLQERLEISAAHVDRVFGDIVSHLGEAATFPHRRPATAERSVPDLGALPDKAAGAPAFLTPREREVLAHISTGATNAQIARALVISEETVKSHLKQISKKLGTTTRSAAVARFAQLTHQSSVHGT
ncbi:LuxR C-terminal-related transcriptional regulator [Gordonia terrae]|uniref:helix-turn-helix transcriptional regulator n=1 Tax=Gordonia terrae TaxID=2055 RepID=UPI00200AD1C0|nr:LuxR C-terminal-related transcriptional regulator [Gordonia terrae]UPW10073.1 LuxR C-terminal-related transcriptional regulator [Gordonia terrae]